MNHRTEVDIALLGYAIQIETEGQCKRAVERNGRMNQFKPDNKYTNNALRSVDGTTLETNK